MIDWIIMGIVFAMIVCFAVYIVSNNKRQKQNLEKRSFPGWLIEIISSIHH